MRIRLAARQAVLATALLILSPAAFGQERFTGKVVGVTDGDTISVMRDGAAVRVRLDGIDSPESGQDFGQRAKQFASELVFGKTATVERRDVDRYGRIVGRVFVDGQDLSLALVRAGLAWHYTQYSSDQELAAAERAAREAKLGLWRHPRPTAPWEFRRPVRVAADEPFQGPFHGNRRSMVFHRPGCPNHGCVNCTAVFKTREEAVRAGYRPAGDCLR